MERLMELYRKYNSPNRTPLEIILLLCAHYPDSIKINQYVWEQQKPIEEIEDEDEDEEEDRTINKKEDVYFTCIVVLDEFKYEAIDPSKNKSVELAAEKCVDCLERVAVAHDITVFNQIMALQSLTGGGFGPYGMWPWVPIEYNSDSSEESSDESKESDKLEDNATEKLDKKENEVKSVDFKFVEGSNPIIVKWIELLDQYKSVKSYEDTEVEILEKLNSLSDKPILDITTTNPIPPLKMYSTKIEIYGLDSSSTTPFVGKSPFGRSDSHWEAAIKIVQFFDNFVKLVNHFKYSYSPDKEPYKLVVGLIHQNSDMIKMVKSGSDLVGRSPRFSTKIEIVNVITVEEKGPRSGDIASGRVVHYLKQLSKLETIKKAIEENKNKSTTLSKIDNKPTSVESKPENLKPEKLKNLFEKDKKVVKAVEQRNKVINVSKVAEKKPKENVKMATIPDESKKAVKKKLDSLKVGQFKQKLIAGYRLAISTNRSSPLEVIDYLKSKGIRIEITKDHKRSHFSTSIEFPDYPGVGPQFSADSRKKLDSRKAAARKLVDYLKRIAQEEKVDLPADNEEEEDGEINANEQESITNKKEAKSEQIQDDFGESPNRELIEKFNALNQSKKTPLELLDMLKSRGVPIEIIQNVSQKRNSKTQEYNHVTKIILDGKLDFCADSPKKVESKRLAAQKVVQYLRQLSRSGGESRSENSDDKEEESNDSDQESDEDDTEVEEEKGEQQNEQNPQFSNVRSNSGQSDEPLWGHYEAEKPFITKQRKPWMRSTDSLNHPVRTTVTVDELERSPMVGPLQKERDGPSEDKIKQIIALIRRFDKVNSKSKGKLQIIHELKEQGQPLKIFRTVQEKKSGFNGTLLFHVSVNIEGIAYFEENSPDKKQSEAYALRKTLRFLKNVSHLVKNFIFVHSRTKYPTEIIERLMEKNFEMLVMTEQQQQDGFHKIVIEVVNVGHLSGRDRDRLRAKEIAMTKTAYLLMKLAQLNSTLKVKDYINSVHLHMKGGLPETIRNQIRVRRENQRSDKNNWDEKEEEDYDDEEDDYDEEGDEEDYETQIKPTYSELFKKDIPKEAPKEPNHVTTPTPTQPPYRLERVIKLAEKFSSFSSSLNSLSSVEIQMSIIDCLRASGEPIKVQAQVNGTGDARLYSLTIDIKDVATFSGMNRDERLSKVEALEKTFDFLKNISLLVQNYKNIANTNTNSNEDEGSKGGKVETNKTNKIEESKVEEEYEENEESDEEEEDEDEKVEDEENEETEHENKQSNLETILEMFKKCYTLTKTATQILDELLELSSSYSQLIQMRQIHFNTQHITTIQLGGDGQDLMEVFSGTAPTVEQAKLEASVKLIHYLVGQLQVQIEEQLDLKQLVPDQSLLLDSAVSKAVYEVVQQQWSVLSHANPVGQFKSIAAFVITSDLDEQFIRVVSIGTGSECLPKEALNYTGQVLLDLHAEVIARRALLCYIYEQVHELANNSQNPEVILEPGTNGFRVKQHLKLHLYLSGSPCGSDEENFKSELPIKSCIDKIKSWNVLGVQGALLGSFIEPIYLSSVILSDLAQFDKQTNRLYDGLDRSLLTAMLESMGLDQQYGLNRHKIGYYKPAVFGEDKSFQPSVCACLSTNLISNDICEQPIQEYPISHNWYRPTNCAHFNPMEIVHTQLGTILGSPAALAASRLSKLSLLRRFQVLTQQYPGLVDIEQRVCSNTNIISKSNSAGSMDYDLRPYYRGAKNRSTRYRDAKRALIDTHSESNLGGWVKAPIHVDLFLV